LLSHEQYLEFPLSASSSDAFGDENDMKFENMTLEQLAENCHVCKECGRGFPKLVSLKSHEMVHLGLKKHTCEYCLKSFARRHDMLRHERTVHSTEKNLTCATCNILFGTLELITEHCSLQNHAMPEQKAAKTKSLRKLSIKRVSVQRVRVPSGSDQNENPTNRINQWMNTSNSNQTLNNFEQTQMPQYLMNQSLLNQNYQMQQPYQNLQQAYTYNQIDPTYTQYGQPILDNQNYSQNIFNGQIIQPQVFQPNMNQAGYQMRQNVPFYTSYLQPQQNIQQEMHMLNQNILNFDLLEQQVRKKRPLPKLEPLNTSMQQPYFQQSEDLKRIFQFEKQSLPAANFRSEFFDDRFYTLNDGLVIIEEESNEYPTLDPVFNAFDMVE
jgi:hypothetical protein